MSFKKGNILSKYSLKMPNILFFIFSKIQIFFQYSVKKKNILITRFKFIKC
jgi:hypothetical protein